MALKRCRGCNSSFEKRKKDLEKVKAKKTNITQQRHLMESRADVLHVNHNCDVVIMMHHKHGSGDTVTFYGTEGPGVSFIGNKGDKKSSEAGQMALKLFCKFMNDIKSSNPSPSSVEKEDCSVTEQSQSASVCSASKAQPPPNLLPAASDSQPCSNCVSNVPGDQSTSHTPHIQVSLPTRSMSRPSTNLSSESHHHILQSTSSVSSPTSPTSPSETEMVVYMVNGVALAGGYIDRQRDTLHGKKVPNTHVCVMLTTAKPNIKAPFIAGDIEENSFLEKGKFFALPKTSVVRAILRKN